MARRNVEGKAKLLPSPEKGSFLTLTHTQITVHHTSHQGACQPQKQSKVPPLQPLILNPPFPDWWHKEVTTRSLGKTHNAYTEWVQPSLRDSSRKMAPGCFRSASLCPLSLPEMEPKPPQFSAANGRGRSVPNRSGQISPPHPPTPCDLGQITQLPRASVPSPTKGGQTFLAEWSEAWPSQSQAPRRPSEPAVPHLTPELTHKRNQGVLNEEALFLPDAPSQTGTAWPGWLGPDIGIKTPGPSAWM